MISLNNHEVSLMLAFGKYQKCMKAPTFNEFTSSLEGWVRQKKSTNIWWPLAVGPNPALSALNSHSLVRLALRFCLANEELRLRSGDWGIRFWDVNVAFPSPTLPLFHTKFSVIVQHLRRQYRIYGQAPHMSSNCFSLLIKCRELRQFRPPQWPGFRTAGL